MTISELVKRLLEADASAEAVAIAIQAIEEERLLQEETQAPRRRRKARKPDSAAGLTTNLGGPFGRSPPRPG